ncbi:CBS domain protein [compost metagenome]
MHSKIMAVQDTAPVEDAIGIIRKYDLLAVPVVANNGKLVGIITVDDVIDAVLPQRRRKLLKFA